MKLSSNIYFVNYCLSDGIKWKYFKNDVYFFVLFRDEVQNMDKDFSDRLLDRKRDNVLKILWNKFQLDLVLECVFIFFLEVKKRVFLYRLVFKIMI